MLTNRFLFSYREWASGISLYLFLLSVFMCSWHCLILSEHCQLKWEYATKKMQQKIVGAPEVWCPFKLTTGFFIVISRMNIRNINLSFIPSVFMCSWRFLVISEYCQQHWGYTTKKTPNKLWGHQNSGALSSWQLVFHCRLENGHQEYQFVFFPKCIYVFLAFPGFIRILPA